MIKKYFAMTIIAASVSLAACSSDDDDEGTTPPVTTGEGTAYDLIAGTGNHNILLGLIDGAGLDATLDSAAAASVFTVFAPDDAAFAAYDAAVAAGLVTTEDDTDDLTALADLTDAQVSRILLNHVVNGSIATPEDATVLDTLAVADETADPALVAQTLTVSIDAEGNTSVAAIGGQPVPVDATLTGTEADAVEQDIVHSVGSILLPSDLPADEGTTDGGDTGGDTGSDTGAAALIGSGTAYSEAGGEFLSLFANSLNNTDGNVDAFTFFVPSNAALTAASLVGDDLTLPVVQRHIQTSVAALVDGGTVTTVGPEGGSHSVAADGSGGFTVGTFAVTLLGSTPEGGAIYGIEGVLP